MTMHSIHAGIFTLVVLLFVTLVAVLLFLATRREVASENVAWETLLERLNTVDRDAVHAIATDLLEGSDRIRPEEMFTMLGGLEGLERLAQNCQVLVELATFVQRWQPQALTVAEELRLGAREMQWHLDRLRGASKAGHLRSTYPDNAARAVSVYYTMTRKVLSLYEDTAFARLTTLQRAL